MAITRHTHRLHQVENSRLLRSRRVVATSSPRLSHPHHSRKSCHLLSTASKHPGGEQQRPSKKLSTSEDIHLQGRRDSIRNTQLPHGQRTFNMSDEVGDGGSDSAILDTGSVTAVPDMLTPSLPTCHHLTAIAQFDHTACGEEEECERSVMGSSTSSVGLDDVGIPSDGLWDQISAYEQRFCYDHGESEYLLGTDNRWMFSTDFAIRDAELKLEARLRKHKEDPSAYEPHTRRCQAECHGNLLSHVHSVIDRRKNGDHNLYLIEWKACWTPESKISDKTWIGESLKSNKNISCRRSTRVENVLDDRKRRFENMMLVINIR